MLACSCCLLLLAIQHRSYVILIWHKTNMQEFSALSYWFVSNSCATRLSIKEERIFHPSIFYTRLIRWSGRGGAGAYPSGYWARGGVHPGQVASPSQKREYYMLELYNLSICFLWREFMYVFLLIRELLHYNIIMLLLIKLTY